MRWLLIAFALSKCGGQDCKPVRSGGYAFTATLKGVENSGVTVPCNPPSDFLVSLTIQANDRSAYVQGTENRKDFYGPVNAANGCGFAFAWWEPGDSAVHHAYVLSSDLASGELKRTTMGQCVATYSLSAP